MSVRAMTIPLWCLAGYVVWIVGLVVALTLARLRHLQAGGSHREFGIPDDRRLVWRLFRAHANAVENLPLFASVVLIATVRDVTGPAIDTLAVVHLAARVLHSLVHAAPGAGLPNRRFQFLVVQVVSLAGLTVLAVWPAPR